MRRPYAAAGGGGLAEARVEAGDRVVQVVGPHLEAGTIAGVAALANPVRLDLRSLLLQRCVRLVEPRATLSDPNVRNVLSGTPPADDVPLPSRIILVADAFEAMTSDRPYRAGLPEADAFAELEYHAGSQFDRECVTALRRALGAADPDPDPETALTLAVTLA